jgi:subtilase family serine protease
MRQSITFRRSLVSLMILFFLFVATLSSFVLVNSVHAATDSYVSIGGSYSGTPAGAQLRGQHADNSQLTISVALHSRNEAELNNLLAELYDPSSSQFHQWLSTGEFNALFAPTSSQVAQVQSFLRQAGLSVSAGSSTPFLLQATGTTAQMEAAFRTHLSDYTAAKGQMFFQNDSAIQIPASLSNVVLGVMGLSNTARLHAPYITTRQGAQEEGKPVPQYGAGPGGSGLVPSQTASLYGANGVYQLGSQGRGKGATLAVFELSGYTPADITAYENQFFGPSENVPLVDINVDGGPITPKCPSGDQCGPFGPSCPKGCDSADYSGDVEVEADIETQIAIAPQIDRILVYNAPTDALGITVLDEYFKIANDNLADSISSSWGLCEPDAGLAMAQAESIAFKQMATQGQSMFVAAGDTGAYDCLRDTGSPNMNSVSVDDPGSQPFVTGVGGTSFGTFDPGSNLHPSYPKGFETVWNVLNQCSGKSLTNCLTLGAGGGGVSSFWGRLSYQRGSGVINSFSQMSPYCSQATAGQYCREVPDVSANADEFTPYAEYCTGNPATNSTCALLSSGQPVPGWFGIGGTSLSSPLWSGIIALWDSVQGQRFGNANAGLYELFRSDNSYSQFFHDITGKNQTENNNGLYPTTPNYDMATGIGSPRISGIAEYNP